MHSCFLGAINKQKILCNDLCNEIEIWGDMNCNWYQAISGIGMSQMWREKLPILCAFGEIEHFVQADFNIFDKVRTWKARDGGT